MKKQVLSLNADFLSVAASLPKEAKAKLIRILWLLSEDFRHPSLQTKKVKGSKSEVYECRVDQVIRLIYDISGGNLRCWYVGDHDAALTFAINFSQSDGAVIVDDIEMGKRTAASDVRQYLSTGRVPEDFMDVPLDRVHVEIGLSEDLSLLI